MPALVAVALLGIILNLILNWGQIVDEIRQTRKAITAVPKAAA
jgi:hypothetical protein